MATRKKTDAPKPETIYGDGSVVEYGDGFHREYRIADIGDTKVAQFRGTGAPDWADLGSVATVEGGKKSRAAKDAAGEACAAIIEADRAALPPKV